MHFLKLYFRFVVIYFKSCLEYRLAFIGDIIMQIVIFGTSFVSLWLFAYRFKTMGGWNFYELIFLSNLDLFAYGVAGFVFWGAMWELGDSVNQGTFDSMLIYPLNPLFHICLRQLSYEYVGNIILGGTVFYICFQKLAFIWTLSKIIWFGIVILGASMIHLAILIAIGACAFWMRRIDGVVGVTIYGFKIFTQYPLKIYGRGVQFLLTFMIPYGFVAFYPAQYFLAKSGDYLFHPVLQFATPLVGLVALYGAYQFWKLGLSRYQSAGA